MYIREVLVMKSKGIFIVLLLLTITVFISACTPKNPPSDNDNISKELEEQLKEKNNKISELEKKIKELEEDKVLEEDEHLLTTSINVLKSLQNEDMEKLKDYIHPERGVRFSPYSYVDLEKNIILKRDEIVDVFNDSKTYIWGNYDGKGDPIELSFKDYYKEFVYDKDFLNPQIIGNNYIVSSGNSLDNVKEAYPNGKFAELYFKGFEEQFEGIDWESLKLVFEKQEGKWYLVGIIHGQWTI